MPNLPELQATLLHPFILLFLLIILFTRWLFIAIRTSKNNLPPSPSKLSNYRELASIRLAPSSFSSFLVSMLWPNYAIAPRWGAYHCSLFSGMAREITKTYDISFANRPNSRIGSRLLYQYKDLSLSSYGEYWRQMRSICVVQLLSARRVRSFRSIREEETALMVKKIKQSCSSPVDLSEFLASFSNDVICRIAFSRKYSEGEDGMKFKVLLEELGALLGMFDVGDYIPWLSWINHFTGLNARVKKSFNEFDTFLNGVLDNHIALRSVNGDVARKDQMDLVDVLLEMQNDGGNCVFMGRDNIKAIILDMFAGGADTTYTAIEWAMTEILRHPEVMKKAQEEVRGIVGSKQNVNEDDLGKMVFLKSVIKETLRLHPPVPILLPRVSKKDVQVGGYDISAKTRVLINAWAIGRDPESWEEAEKFKPERFLGSDVDFKGRDHFQFIPFGPGRTGCPGSTFAIANVDLVLASLLHKFNWALPGEARGEDLDVSESTGIAIHRKFPLTVVTTPYYFEM